MALVMTEHLITIPTTRRPFGNFFSCKYESSSNKGLRMQVLGQYSVCQLSFWSQVLAVETIVLWYLFDLQAIRTLLVLMEVAFH